MIFDLRKCAGILLVIAALPAGIVAIASGMQAGMLVGAMAGSLAVAGFLFLLFFGGAILIWTISFFLYRRQSYRISIALSLLCCMNIPATFRLLQLLPADHPPSGYLVPTSHSVPANFSKTSFSATRRDYRKSFYVPEILTRRIGHVLEEEISFEESNQTYEEGLNTCNGHEYASPRNFVFNNSPGVLYDFTVRFAQLNPKTTGLAQYDLHYNEKGRNLHITVLGVAQSDYPPERIIDILKTMVVEK